MEFKTNKEKGRTGLALAIGYFGSNGYTVSVPLNDTQDYDLIVDKDRKLFRISVKATGQRSRHGISICNLRNFGGTKGSIYGRENKKDIDFMFIVNECKEMWLVPKDALPSNSINLGKDCDKYRI